MDGGAPAIAAALEQALGGVLLDDLPLFPRTSTAPFAQPREEGAES